MEAKERAEASPCKYPWSYFGLVPEVLRALTCQGCCHLIVCPARNVIKDLTAELGHLNGLCELSVGTPSIMQGVTALPLFPVKPESTGSYDAYVEIPFVKEQDTNISVAMMHAGQSWKAISWSLFPPRPESVFTRRQMNRFLNLIWAVSINWTTVRFQLKATPRLNPWAAVTCADSSPDSVMAVMKRETGTLWTSPNEESKSRIGWSCRTYSDGE